MEGGHWSRGLVIEISSPNFVKVFLVDVGVDKPVSRDNLRLLKKEFVTAMPMSAHRCSLAGVVPKEGKKWSRECVEFFR